jgi:hypothetical protein
MLLNNSPQTNIIWFQFVFSSQIVAPKKTKRYLIIYLYTGRRFELMNGNIMINNIKKVSERKVKVLLALVEENSKN